ncbi:MAG: hypothetical protein D6788_11285 [Planctomycetota bacterium]|nr:MAG: hypothetical protein D6788_11285 [Planctomycetota bacterium]
MDAPPDCTVLGCGSPSGALRRRKREFAKERAGPMKRCWICLGVSAGLLAMALGSGCVMIAGFPCAFHTTWSEEVKERITLDASAAEAVTVETHNGKIDFTGTETGTQTVVEATKRAGGSSVADARKALEALEVFAEPDPADPGTIRVGWRWKTARHPASWKARVSFEITAPAGVRLSAETHNGGIKVRNVAGPVELASHNGGIKAVSIHGPLEAETHNGKVVVSGAGEKLRIVTHNGSIRAEFTTPDLAVETHNGSIALDLRNTGPVDARVTTHNGNVVLTVGEKTSARLQAETSLGSIACQLPLKEPEVSAGKHRLRGVLGDGQGTMVINTHNGGIRVKSAEKG